MGDPGRSVCLSVKAFISDHALHAYLKKQPRVVCAGCSVLDRVPTWLLPASLGLCSMDERKAVLCPGQFLYSTIIVCMYVLQVSLWMAVGNAGKTMPSFA